MNEPANDDLLPEHTEIDAFLAASIREHAERLAAVLDLDAGLAAILTPDDDADRGEPVIAANPGSLSPSRVGTSLPGGQAAIIIIAIRSHVLAFARDLDRARTRSNAFALANDLADALGDARDLSVALSDALACALASADTLDRVAAFATTLDRALASAKALASGNGHRRVDADARDPIYALIGETQRALTYASELASQFEAVEVDASAADLSTLDIKEMRALEGVVWTEETTWPPGVREQVQSRSREIRPGVYKVQGDSERDPSELIST